MRGFLCCLFASALLGAAPTADAFGNLHWRLIGPFRGGRALAVTGVPGQPVVMTVTRVRTRRMVAVKPSVVRPIPVFLAALP